MYKKKQKQFYKTSKNMNNMVQQKIVNVLQNIKKIGLFENIVPKYCNVLQHFLQMYFIQIFCVVLMTTCSINKLNYHAASWSAPSIAYGYWEVGNGYIGGRKPSRT